MVDVLRGEGLSVSKTGILQLLRKYEVTGTIERRPGSGRPTKVRPMPSNDDDSEIHVPDTCCPWSFDMLCQKIDPLASCNDYGIDCPVAVLCINTHRTDI